MKSLINVVSASLVLTSGLLVSHKAVASGKYFDGNLYATGWDNIHPYAVIENNIDYDANPLMLHPMVQDFIYQSGMPKFMKEAYTRVVTYIPTKEQRILRVQSYLTLEKLFVDGRNVLREALSACESGYNRDEIESVMKPSLNNALNDVSGDEKEVIKHLTLAFMEVGFEEAPNDCK